MALKKSKSKDYPSASLQGGLVEEAVLAYSSAKGAGSYLGVVGGFSYDTNAQERQLKIIRGGLTRDALDVLMEKTGLSIYELADILEVTDRTLRRYPPDEVLNKRLSERALEIAKLYSRGEEVMGSAVVFRQWMEAPIPALEHKLPKSFLDTSLGISMLMDELGRIEHGVFA